MRPYVEPSLSTPMVIAQEGTRLSQLSHQLRLICIQYLRRVSGCRSFGLECKCFHTHSVSIEFLTSADFKPLLRETA